MQNKKIQLYFFYALLLGVLIVAFFIFRPFLSSLVLAVILATVFYPLYEKLLPRLGNRKNLTAFILVLFIILIVFIPLIFLGLRIFAESKNLYNSLGVDGPGFFQKINYFVDNQIKDIFPQFNFDLKSYVGDFTSWFSNSLGKIFSATAGVLFSFFILLISLFYFFRDGRKFEEGLIKISPLPTIEDKSILSNLNRSIGGVLKGALFIAIIQGFLVGLGFFIFKIPNPILFGGVAMVASFIPSIGTALVLVPAIIYLFFFGTPLGVLGLAIWGIVVVGLVDNFLNPILVGHKINLHPFLVFLSVLGGIIIFGPLGFFLGPIILSLLNTLFEIYSTGFKEN